MKSDIMRSSVGSSGPRRPSRSIEGRGTGHVNANTSLPPAPPERSKEDDNDVDNDDGMDSSGVAKSPYDSAAEADASAWPPRRALPFELSLELPFSPSLVAALLPSEAPALLMAAAKLVCASGGGDCD